MEGRINPTLDKIKSPMAGRTTAKDQSPSRKGPEDNAKQQQKKQSKGKSGKGAARPTRSKATTPNHKGKRHGAERGDAGKSTERGRYETEEG